ncbi:MAG: hypothetical protein ABI772_10575 [Bacteroidota bacterium]
MSRIIITNEHLVKHKVKAGVIHLEFKSRLRVSLITKLGFSMKRDKNKVKLHNLQPVMGFSRDPDKLEFREKYREGLLVTYHLSASGIEITIADLNGDDEIIPLKKV